MLAASACSGPCSSSFNALSAQEENNRKIAISYFEEIVNRRNLDLVNKIFSPDYIDHEMDGTENHSIKAGTFIPFLQKLFKAFPDLHYTIKSAITEADIVALNLSASATHKDAFLGFPASGNKINYKQMHFFRIKDGKIMECWEVVDLDALKTQLKSR